MEDIKHVMWLIKQMIVLTLKGDFDGAAEAFFFLRLHFLTRTKAVASLIAAAPAMQRALKIVCLRCEHASYCRQDAPKCEVRAALALTGQYDGK